MFNLARKNLMGRYLMKMRKKFSQQYNFFPLTWMLPNQYQQLKTYFETKQKGKSRTFIVKPEAMSQGKGIFLTRKLEDMEQSNCVVQRYLHRPYLIDGLKFDLRIYVLVAGVDPLRLYIFDEGLARFATEPYQMPTRQNMQDTCMHLTNYAINKDNPKFVFNNTKNDMGTGHKRSLSWLYEYLLTNQPKSQKLKEKIQLMIVKTMIAGLPPIASQYKSCQPQNYASNMCFELLGFDVILTQKCEPVLLEINHTPSFSTDTPLDDHIKTSCIKDALQLMNINQKTKYDIIKSRRQACQQRVITGKKVKLSNQQKYVEKVKAQTQRNNYENKNLGGFKMIYPVEDQAIMQKYEQLLNYSNSSYLSITGITKNKRKVVTSKTQKTQYAFGGGFVRKNKGHSAIMINKTSKGKGSSVKHAKKQQNQEKQQIFLDKVISSQMQPNEQMTEQKYTYHQYLEINRKNGKALIKTQNIAENTYQSIQKREKQIQEYSEQILGKQKQMGSLTKREKNLLQNLNRQLKSLKQFVGTNQKHSPIKNDSNQQSSDKSQQNTPLQIDDTHKSEQWQENPQILTLKPPINQTVSSLSDPNIVAIPTANSNNNNISQFSNHNVYQQNFIMNRKLSQTKNNTETVESKASHRTINTSSPNGAIYSRDQRRNAKNIDILFDDNCLIQQYTNTNLGPSKKIQQNQKRGVSIAFLNNNNTNSRLPTYINTLNSIRRTNTSNKNTRDKMVDPKSATIKPKSYNTNSNDGSTNKRISIALNTLLINGYDTGKGSVVSAQNLRKIINNSHMAI